MKTFFLFTVIFLATAVGFAAPGDLDPAFGNGGRIIDWVGYASDVAIQPDGKIVVLGQVNGGFGLARYNPNGSPDTSFGNGTGRVTTSFGREDYAWSVVIQPDGKIVAGGVSANQRDASFFVARYNPDGTPDPTFGGGTGRVFTGLPCGTSNDNYGADLAIQPDGKLVGVVKFEYCAGQLIRYEPSGPLDISFGNQGIVYISSGLSDDAAVAVQSDVRILVSSGSDIFRFVPNGLPDLDFGSNGFVSTPIDLVRSVIVQPDGKIIGSGSITGFTAFRIARYDTNGFPDNSFGSGGLVTTQLSGAHLASAAIQADGKIVAAGTSNTSYFSDFTLVRYNHNGSLDATFGGGDGVATADFDNSVDFATGMALDPMGRAVVVGYSGYSNRFAIARFLMSSLPSTCIDRPCPQVSWDPDRR